MIVVAALILLVLAQTPTGAGRARGRLLGVEEAAAMLAVSPRFVRRLIAERRIAVHRLGRHIRLAETDLDRFVEAGRAEALRDPRR